MRLSAIIIFTGEETKASRISLRHLTSAVTPRRLGSMSRSYRVMMIRAQEVEKLDSIQNCPEIEYAASGGVSSPRLGHSNKRLRQFGGDGVTAEPLAVEEG